MKKLFALIACIAVIAVTAAACGKGEEKSKGETEKSSEKIEYYSDDSSIKLDIGDRID